jgi:hypothetical protein
MLMLRNILSVTMTVRPNRLGCFDSASFSCQTMLRVRPRAYPQQALEIAQILVGSGFTRILRQAGKIVGTNDLPYYLKNAYFNRQLKGQI